MPDIVFADEFIKGCLVQPEVVVKVSATIKRDDFDVGDVSPLDVSSQMSLACSFVSGTEQIAKAITIARVA